MDRGVIATASELFTARHYPSVIAVCSDALDQEPDCLPLLLLRARAHIALRRLLDAQADLRDIVRLDPECSLAYRLLGELAAHRAENDSAAVFFREALRLDPGDRSAHDWLQIVEGKSRPPPPRPERAAPAEPIRLARGTRPLDHPDERPERAERNDRGEHGERPTQPMARGSARDAVAWVARPSAQPVAAAAPIETVTLRGRPPMQPPAKPAPMASPRLIARAAPPELPGFGEYLVTSGILSRERLRAAEAYQRSMRVQLSTAIITLGLVTPQRMASAAVAHQSQLARERDP